MSTQPAKRTGPLARLSDADLRILSECATRLSFKKDQEIIRQGQRNASLYFIEEGLLHVRRRVKERDMLLGRLGAGSFFGEISLFDPGPTTATVRAVSDGTLLELRREHLDRFIAQRPVAGAEILAGFLEEMAVRLRRTDERLSDSITWGGLLRD